MSFFVNVLKGILIGAGAILPGISSGVICVILGIYEELLDKLIHFFKAPIENIKLFLPYIIGGVIGVLLVGKLLLYFFSSFHTATCFAFIGLILGCIPSIIKQCSNDISNKLLHWLCLILTFIFSIYLIALEYNHNSDASANTAPLNLGISGFFMSVGVVIPGVSSSVILMIMDIYDTYLNAISTVNLAILIPMGIGLLLGGVLFLKLINLLFKHFRSYTYYAIIGFTLGSVLVIFPGLSATSDGIIGIILFTICFILSSSMEKFNKK